MAEAQHQLTALQSFSTMCISGSTRNRTVRLQMRSMVPVGPHLASEEERALVAGTLHGRTLRALPTSKFKAQETRKRDAEGAARLLTVDDIVSPGGERRVAPLMQQVRAAPASCTSDAHSGYGAGPASVVPATQLHL